MNEHYSRALDEIYRLRALMAYEARVVDANLHFKSLPKHCRESMERQKVRMQRAAQGKASMVKANISWVGIRDALREAGAEEGLTVQQWEEEVGRE